MIKYFLIFNLSLEGDYKNFYKQLERLRAVKVLDSIYCIKYRDFKTNELLQFFQKFLGKNDGLLVVKSSLWVGKNLIETPNGL